MNEFLEKETQAALIQEPKTVKKKQDAAYLRAPVWYYTLLRYSDVGTSRWRV